ncbi:ergothioneine biosynthesis protein EgtB [Ulvibacter sp. MAR_2010_11]|uniref:ergothioneine biosynthesis protein EgtB n=1 Tax=Ulvibacter sp. MAR_2010_11 TaxID=1250229 RepID=UPI000C2C835F|nr:ergothioneine biosynthesis protein EgtB [Ulvibacter sp. MAR_2010_11]PKA83331.1 ergothioneine biosynthesis protein EgtB [Ulvibacter sp. MAR_2010_11]
MIATKNLVTFFLETREHTENICKPLEIEDYVVQPIVDVSPPKWHLGHTTWFFEEFILKPYKPNYKLFHNDFAFVFNSYYENVGKRVVRTDRGNMSRPGVAMVYDYRHYVTRELTDFLNETTIPEVQEILLIGIHHEKQHQELLLTDIKYILGHNPLLPVYHKSFSENLIETQRQEWIAMSEGIYTIGHNDSHAFCYDNELGKHSVFIHDFEISNRLITNREYLAFVEAGGYKDHNLWHAEGWDWNQKENIKQPMYWHLIEGEWYQFTLAGPQKIVMDAPVAHISYFEAFAFAQWMECRLPTEFEWEVAQDNFTWGSRWEWTESAYLPYPGYQKVPGALGEYNGKFMVNQKVLRGASVATPDAHSRPTYRNFFQTNLRWQFTGIRLAK